MFKVGLNPTPPDAPVSRTGRCPCLRSHRVKHTDGRHMSSFKSAPHGLNGYFHSTVCVHGRTGRADGMHRTPQGQRPVDSSKVPKGKRALDTSAGGDRTHPSVPWSLGLATRLRHLHRTLTHCVWSPAKMHRTRRCTVACVRSLSFFARASAWTDWTRRCPRGQLPVTSSDLFLKTLANVPTTLCITLCTYVSIFLQIFSRVMLALH
jgi:hypothetical protein